MERAIVLTGLALRGLSVLLASIFIGAGACALGMVLS